MNDRRRRGRNDAPQGGYDVRDPQGRSSIPGNLILAELSADESMRLRPYLTLVPLKPGEVLWEQNEPISFVYFPTSGLVSFVTVMRDGATVEVAMTGREGFAGVPILLGATRTAVRAVVQIRGQAYRIEAILLSQILPDIPRLERALRGYAYAFVTQLSQIAACNRLHQTPDRLARWLAMSRERTGSDVLALTQEFLAQMLGCRRSSVTSAAGLLQKSGAIRCTRGSIRIVNCKELERRACECLSALAERAHDSAKTT
ncbi:MAG TPA: Crp/Fnr family transcriptional regulator [Terriglobales bacterium]|nr:Crp/Fnr family transcriptional regulator [Terriglobales bacterium]